MQTTILLTIDHDKPIRDLPELVAGRAWTIDGVRKSEVKFWTHEKRLANPVVPLSQSDYARLISRLDGRSLLEFNLYNFLSGYEAL